jgi:hypothetical protein
MPVNYSKRYFVSLKGQNLSGLFIHFGFESKAAIKEQTATIINGSLNDPNRITR